MYYYLSFKNNFQVFPTAHIFSYLFRFFINFPVKKHFLCRISVCSIVPRYKCISNSECYRTWALFIVNFYKRWLCIQIQIEIGISIAKSRSYNWHKQNIFYHFLLIFVNVLCAGGIFIIFIILNTYNTPHAHPHRYRGS